MSQEYLEEKILEILKTENKALSAFDLEAILGLKKDDFKLLIVTLNKMEECLQIYRTKKNNYMLFTNSHLKVGMFLGNKKGFGFVDINDSCDVFIPSDSVNGAIHGDRVIVEITSKSTQAPEGRVLKIVDRNLNNMVGEFYYRQGKGYVDLDDKRIKINISIDKSKTMGAMNGHKVLVKITNKFKDNNYNGEVIRILGHKNDPGVDILSITAKYDINDVFSDQVMKQALDLPSSVSIDEMKNRRDLRDECIFTIDGDDTKDIDDAISLKVLDNGNYLLGVHIADVSYYVTENSPLDIEAFDRGTSVYLADRVIPMLPHKLSNGICSLNPNVDRLAMSCVMEIDRLGNTVNYEIFESVIKSRIQMTYRKVNSILEDGVVPDGYEPYVDVLKQMSEVAKILRKYKENRGYIDFLIDESKIIVDDRGKAIDVQLRERGTGQRMIEDFMIAANETVASHIYYMDLPFVYRVHGEPSEDKISSFKRFVSVLGYKITGVKEVNPKSMQYMLGQLKEKDEFSILSSLLLRSMQKAFYDKTNIGHFGLASKCYTHFTSPIRRYPDLMVHRLLRKYLFENKIDNDVISYYDNKLVEVTDHSSLRERGAINCEREVDDMKKAEYMMDHVGEEFDGIISSVTSFGMFVQLPNLIEGLVRLDDMDDDFYVFNEETFSITGKNNKRGYRLGDKVSVIVKQANKEAKTIDFILKKN